MTIPLFDTETPLAGLRQALVERVTAVIEGGRFILGPEVAAFERELAAYLGVAEVVGVGNGTDALSLAAQALGIGPGDEVVVPSFTFYASAEAIAAIGARPVFCDVDRDTRNLTVATVRPALSPRTKAIVAVDLFGVPAEIPAIRDAFGLPVIEDAAQALGASLAGRRAGALGDVATLSFYPSKNLGACGDAGAVATDDAALAERVRTLRSHGSRDKQTFDEVGCNSRLDELQAAILRVLLPHVDDWCEGRRTAAQHYLEAGLAAVLAVPGAPPEAVPAWHLYVVTDPDADARLAALARAGVQARPYYRVPLHRQPAMAAYVDRAGPAPELPVTDELAATNLALPISPVLTRAMADEVVAALAA